MLDPDGVRVINASRDPLQPCPRRAVLPSRHIFPLSTILLHCIVLHLLFVGSASTCIPFKAKRPFCLQVKRRLPVRLRFEKLEAKLFLPTRKVHTRQASADDHSIPREVRYVFAQSLIEQRYLLVYIGMNIREFTKRLWVPSSATMRQRRR